MISAEASNGSKGTGNGARPDNAATASGSKRRSPSVRGDNGAKTAARNSTTGSSAEASGETLHVSSGQAMSNGNGKGSSTEVRSGGRSAQSASSPTENGMTGKASAMPYPAPSVGLPSPMTFATSLLNLEVKVLTQALGAENQWVEQGDGRVSFCDFTIRVSAPKPNKQNGLKEQRVLGNASASSPGAIDTECSASPAASQDAAKNTPAPDEKSSAMSNTVSDVDENEEDEMIILEDTISNDTPFVGENCCIVWNSFEKQLSLCLMYASEEGYSASWSALVALQDKSYPPFRYDLLERCRPASERSVLVMTDSGSSDTTISSPVEKADESVLPYAYFIHERHNPPLSFIEQHALSLSIMEHHHASNLALYENKETVVAMLSIANADLLDHLISDQTFPLLLSGLKCSADSAEWVVPAQLRELHIPADVTASIAKDRRITFLQESVLPTCCVGETLIELMTKYSTLSRRIRNDIVCGLLTCDALFTEASEALRIAPPVMTNTTTPGSMMRNRISSMDSSANTSSASLSSEASPMPVPATNDVVQAQKAEQQVLAHLRFFRELVTLSISELGRDMVGPIVDKVYQCGLLYSLSLVAERFAMPANMAAVFAKRLTDNNGGGLSGNRKAGAAAMGSAGGNSNASSTSSATPNGANYYSPAVEQELAALLDATLVRINERQEEQLMNDHVRIPILGNPLKYNGLVTFMVRQLTVIGAATGSSVSSGANRTTPSGNMLPQPKRIMRDNMSTSNPFVIFHVLGLHDDEGSAASERVLDAESTYERNQFQNFIITKYLAHAIRGIMPPVPLPPSLGGVAARNTPIVRFDNAAAAQNGSVRGTHYDGIEASTSTIIGVPNTGVGVGTGSVCPSGGGSSSGDANGGASSAHGHCSQFSTSVPPLPQGITPALIRVLEYLVILTSRANRELLLKTVFHTKSHILHFIEGACDVLCNTSGMGGRCQIGLDVLCGCVRFLKVVIRQMSLPASEQDDNPLPSYGSLPEPLSVAQTTTICRQLTVERDTFGYLLKAYNKLGGVRRNTVFHSSLLALLDIISRSPAKESEDMSTNNLRDVRAYLFYRHLTRLPEVFARRFREQLLDEVSLRLGREAQHSPNDSVSVLSSTIGSELLRSANKLRFVDEVEAVAGGVDGTVVPGTVMNPAIVANMANAEEKQRKRNARSTLGQWTATATHVMPSSSHVRAVAALSLPEENSSRLATTTPPATSSSGTRASSPLTISITRPGNTNAGSPRSLFSDASKSNSSTVGASPPPLSIGVANGATTPHPMDATNGSGNGSRHTAEDGATLAPASTAAAGTPAGNKNNSRGNTGTEGGATTANGTANGAALLKPTAPKNEKPPGRPRNFASVLETSTKNAESGGGKSRSMPNMTVGTLSPPSSPEETWLAKTSSIATPTSLENANGCGDGRAANSGSPSLPPDNIILPKIKKRASASGKRS
ncbi:hypothetical protein ABL78_0658 [Leptomonas seymouri]|uniref:Uncharacterized protein n=1 Tax=Leptomonas seymouri TaxID=5684 RepID=A0A0N0P8R9_LEPSE|nr:hypothetical protein ABL78_0658 [Leptomonas seymouri]|eukprot:KPI90276.1 hypothetical protein ABL78_0658 [Leptomonas seymouri]